MRISAQQTINDAFFSPIEVEYGKDGGKTYSLQSDPLKILIPGFIENESVPNYAISFGLMIISPDISQSYLILNIANVKESSLFTAFKDNSEPVYSLNIGGTSFVGTGQDTGNGNFGIMFFASKDDFGKLTETLASEHNITASISKNATNLKIHIGAPNENNTQRAKGFGSLLLLMQSQLNDYIKNDRSQPSSSSSSSSSVRQGVDFSKIWLEHNVNKNGEIGMQVHVSFTIYGKKSQKCTAIAYFDNPKGVGVKDTNGRYCTSDGTVSTSVDFYPEYDNTTYSDLSIFIPNSELHLLKGKRTYYSRVFVFSNGKNLGNSEFESFDGDGN